MLGVGTTGPTGIAVMVDDTTSTTASERMVETIRATPAAEERDAWAVLAGVRGVGPVGFGTLLRRYGSVLAVLREAAAAASVSTGRPVIFPDKTTRRWAATPRQTRIAARRSGTSTRAASLRS